MIIITIRNTNRSKTIVTDPNMMAICCEESVMVDFDSTALEVVVGNVVNEDTGNPKVNQGSRKGAGTHRSKQQQNISIIGESALPSFLPSLGPGLSKKIVIN